MMAAGLLLLAFADPPITLSAVALEAENGRPVVRIVTSIPLVPRVERVGRELVVVLPGARARPGLPLPPPVAEIEALAIEDDAAGVRLRIRLEGDVAYELRADRGFVSVVLGPPRARGRAPADVRELYAKILPPPAGEGPEPQQGGSRDAASEPSQQTEGLRIGFLRLRPSLVTSYVDADTSLLDTPRPVHDRYFQFEPHLGFGIGAQLPLPGQGRLQLTYEPKFRAASSFAELRRPTHLASLSLDAPLGPMVSLRAAHHYARGFLETTEVDPGREYFFRLAPFARHRTDVGVSLVPGGLLGLDLAAARDSVRIDDQAGFFDHRTDTLASTVSYHYAAASRVYARYRWDHVPTPSERPIAESRASTVLAGLAGEVAPLLTGDASFGFRWLDAPRAAAVGRRYRGVVAGVSLKKEFTPAASVTFNGRRETYPSAFEDNAFYVSTSAGADADLGLPLSMVLHGGFAWQGNAYRVTAVELGAPRRDDIFGWSVGLGRSLTRWAFLRVDYRYDKRTSNLAGFETHGHVFMVEFGIGYLSGSATGLVPK